MSRRARRTALALTSAAGATAVLVSPSTALAHGIVGKTDLPIPRWLFAWAAAVVLVISFVALATLWPRPRLAQVRARTLARVPRLLDPLCGLIGVALFVLVVYAGFAGTQTATANLADTFIYVLFWVGLPFASMLFGDVFRVFNPWRTIARAAGWAAARVPGAGELPKPIAYPERLGRRPAAVLIFGFAWLELIYVQHQDPSRLAVLSLVYAAIQLVAMSIYGIEPWTSRGDGFSVYFNLFARLAPLDWKRDRVELRPPLAGIASLEPAPGTIALLATMIGSTSFDGFAQGSTWNSIEPHIQSFFHSLGASPENALELAGTVGLIGAILVIGGLYWLGILGMRSVGGPLRADELARRFVHSLVPIALAYVIAHYFSLLAYSGQATSYLISDPLGDGSNIFGTASSQIDYSILTPNSIWFVQVGALVLGHAAGLTLAHDRALELYPRLAQATRSQYWMLAVMVGFTSLGLWLLSSAQ